MAIFVLLAVLVSPSFAFDMTEPEIEATQRSLKDHTLGYRIAAWAELFVGTPYDPDPLGAYVRREAVISDDLADCMYHTFRSVELALTLSPHEAVDIALEKRFKTRGVVEGGRVINYDDRYQYGMDMLRSGEWGRDVTSELPGTKSIEGARGVESVKILPKGEVESAAAYLMSGDIVFFVKDPGRRLVGEVVGHIGILKREGDELYLIHASGSKNKQGVVKKVPFLGYVADMPFIGILVGRL